MSAPINRGNRTSNMYDPRQPDSCRLHLLRENNTDPADHLVDVGDARLGRSHLKRPYIDAAYDTSLWQWRRTASEYWNELHCTADSGLNVCFVDYRGYGISIARRTSLVNYSTNHQLVKALGNLTSERLIISDDRWKPSSL